jgi:hypothetical protein
MRSQGTHVEEWASLLDERVSDDALHDRSQVDGRVDHDGWERH